MGANVRPSRLQVDSPKDLNDMSVILKKAVQTALKLDTIPSFCMK